MCKTLYHYFLNEIEKIMENRRKVVLGLTQPQERERANSCRVCIGEVLTKKEKKKKVENKRKSSNYVSYPQGPIVTKWGK